MNRDNMTDRIHDRSEPWDMVIIGGGATGMGIAVDAASRGFDVLLVEQSDFGKGTSSRSTKLVHGGVRYLQQGNVSLVMEALKERGMLLQNAPHLVSDLPFIVPNYEWWEAPFYGVGMKVYGRARRAVSFWKIATFVGGRNGRPTTEPSNVKVSVVVSSIMTDSLMMRACSSISLRPHSSREPPSSIIVV